MKNQKLLSEQLAVAQGAKPTSAAAGGKQAEVRVKKMETAPRSSAPSITAPKEAQAAVMPTPIYVFGRILHPR
jgi:hypothetical protein